MRVCPKCRYVDDFRWRHSFVRQMDYTELQNFKEMQPLLIAELLTEKYVEDVDGLFAYHLTKGMNVERQAVIENPSYRKKWWIPAESAHGHRKKGLIKAIHKHIPGRQKTKQRKLLEVEEG